MDRICLILGVVCLAYYAAIAVYAGPSADFAWFWILLSAAFLAVSFLGRRGLFPLLRRVLLFGTGAGICLILILAAGGGLCDYTGRAGKGDASFEGAEKASGPRLFVGAGLPGGNSDFIRRTGGRGRYIGSAVYVERPDRERD